MNSKFKFPLLLLLLVFFNCTSTKTLRFTKKADDIVKTSALKNFLTENKTPKVVLRVSDASYVVTEDENVDYLYNAIENQLLKSGFVVRDRQLFNQIIGNDENNIDYQKLKEKSDTELIIELIKINPSILYETNKYYDKNNKEKVEKGAKRKRFGASIEFKIVMINSNEFAGVYKFNYTPCVEGCVISKSFKDLKKDAKEAKQKKKEGEVGYEGVEKDILEEFVKNATKQLVEEMRL